MAEFIFHGTNRDWVNIVRGAIALGGFEPVSDGPYAEPVERRLSTSDQANDDLLCSLHGIYLRSPDFSVYPTRFGAAKPPTIRERESGPALRLLRPKSPVGSEIQTIGYGSLAYLAYYIEPRADAQFVTYKAPEALRKAYQVVVSTIRRGLVRRYATSMRLRSSGKLSHESQLYWIGKDAWAALLEHTGGIEIGGEIRFAEFFRVEREHPNRR